MNIALAAGLELLLILIFVGCIMLGKRTGLLKSLIGLLGTVAAIIVAVIFSSQLGTFINDNYVEKPIEAWVMNQLTPDPAGTQSTLESIDFDDLFANTPSFFTDFLNNFGIDIKSVSEKYLEARANDIEQAKIAAVENIAGPISEMVSRVLAFLIIFVLSLILFRLLFWLASFIAKIPIIRNFDTAGGMLFGVIKAILLSFVLIMVVHTIYPYTLEKVTGYTYKQVTEKTIVYKTFEKFNPLSLGYKD
ncbi:MAG: hypothetical protein DBX47_07625 [Clostridiales bacterium]|nr:MAG: hypothetical protein DBX47_07625 [Clostridiales bacterium]